MTNLIQEPKSQDTPLFKECKYCSKKLRNWQYRLIGYCYQCHTRSFQVSRRRLPPYRRWHNGGYQKLLSAGDLERWRKWENAIIERIDREELTAKGAKDHKGKNKKELA